MGGRFIALRDLKEGAGLVKAGSFVPGAERWPHGIIISNVNCGNVYDLHREFKLSGEATRAAKLREGELLEMALKSQNCVLVDDPDHSGRQMLAPVGGEARAVSAVQAANAPKRGKSKKRA